MSSSEKAFDGDRLPPDTSGLALDRVPGFFGPDHARLFGCFHPASGPRTDGEASVAVLCPPLGEEYLRSHRAFLQLAVQLARVGTPSLRFDYRGTGDSAGEWDAPTLEEWRVDLREAVAFARARAGSNGVLLVGLRVGASLALQEASDIEALSGIVLWDPVLDGQGFVESLERRHEAMVRLEYVTLEDERAPAETREALGFPFPRHLRESLLGLDLAPALRVLEAPVLLLRSDGPGAKDQSETIAPDRGTEVVRLDVPRVWMEDPNRGLVPGGVIRAVVDWTGRLGDV